jgi:hypothetical protein
MNGFLAAAGAAVLIALLGLALRYRRPRAIGSADSLRKQALLSSEQRALYVALKSAVGDEYEILGPVRMSEVLMEYGPLDGLESPGSRLGDDERELPGFVLCAPDDLMVAGAVRVADRRPRQPHRRLPEDAALQRLFDKVGVPLVQVDPAPFYDVRELRRAVLEAIERTLSVTADNDGRKEPSITGLDDLDLR